MKSSTTLIERIKDFEGFTSKPYKADKSEQYLTIGYGHYGADVKAGMTVTKEQATQLLHRDLAASEAFVNKLGVCKTQGQFDALVDFAFNLGTGSLASSTLLKRIKARASEKEIRLQFLRWVYCGGKVLPGLVKRRNWEANRFFSQ